MKKILIVAGEESGDMYAGRLASTLAALLPGAALEGIGGPRMRQAGVTTFHGVEEMSSVGVASMLGNLRRFLGILRDLRARLDRGEYEAVILVDYPDFNMRVAKAAKHAGVPVYYYVCPQFWAWRRGRIAKAKQWVDLLLVVFPFEEPFYKERGVDAIFFGHPLLDELPAIPSRRDLKRKYSARPSVPLLGVLPGSRHGEVRRMFPVMLEAVQLIRERMEVEVVIPCAASIDPEEMERRAAQMGVAARIVRGDTWEVMNACDFLICKSGTSTLQAALAKTPMVIVYKSDLFSYYLAKTLSHIPWAGLPNILAGKSIVPELLQTAVSSRSIADKALEYLGDPAAMETMRGELGRVAESLGQPGAAHRAAEIIAGRIIAANAGRS
jgi:lipid-A-disaccharide synthase